MALCWATMPSYLGAQVTCGLCNEHARRTADVLERCWAPHRLPSLLKQGTPGNWNFPLEDHAGGRKDASLRCLPTEISHHRVVDLSFLQRSHMVVRACQVTSQEGLGLRQ